MASAASTFGFPDYNKNRKTFLPPLSSSNLTCGIFCRKLFDIDDEEEEEEMKEMEGRGEGVRFLLIRFW